MGNNDKEAPRRPPKLPHNDVGYEKRVIRSNARIQQALETSLAQDPQVITMGTQVHVFMHVNKKKGKQVDCEIRLDEIDPEKLAFLAIKLRSFLLKSEDIYYNDTIKALCRFAKNDQQKRFIEQLKPLWKACSRSRMFTFAANAQGEELIPGGAGDAHIGDRVLYSQLIHADDESELLDHIGADWQQWSLAALVGDWTAMVAHQQHVMRLIRPDLIPKRTAWAGNALTIFKRFGYGVEFVNPQEDPAAGSRGPS